MAGSDEEADDPHDGDSDEDFSDIDHKEIHEEVQTGPFLGLVRLKNFLLF